MSTNSKGAPEAHDLLVAALDYAAAGWPVCPLRPASKRPATRHGLLDASTDPELIRAWWTTSPFLNLAIRTGDGLAVVDVDPRHGGTRNVSWPETLTARTPSGGVHLYYRVDGQVRNSAGRLAPGVDVRGENGYVVAPPSALDGGRRYSWERLAAPTSISAAILVPRSLPSGRRSAGARLPADWRPYEPPDVIAEGRRHAELARTAGWLRSNGLAADQIEETLLEFNDAACRPPLDEQEVVDIASWAGRLDR